MFVYIWCLVRVSHCVNIGGPNDLLLHTYCISLHLMGCDEVCVCVSYLAMLALLRHYYQQGQSHMSVPSTGALLSLTGKEKTNTSWLSVGRHQWHGAWFGHWSAWQCASHLITLDYFFCLVKLLLRVMSCMYYAECYLWHLPDCIPPPVLNVLT